MENLVMIGTPNSGSLDTLVNLVEGYRPALLLHHYSFALIGIMPAIYELLPRSRHKSVRDNRGHPVDILSPELWQKNK